MARQEVAEADAKRLEGEVALAKGEVAQLEAAQVEATPRAAQERLHATEQESDSLQGRLQHERAEKQRLEGEKQRLEGEKQEATARASA